MTQRIKAYYKNFSFRFNFAAATSRGILTSKDSYFLILENNGCYGIGECSPIPGLSTDDLESYPHTIKEVCQMINNEVPLDQINMQRFPSIQFGLETASMDLKNEGKQIIFPGKFRNGQKGIIINGLIWMGDQNYMEKQIREKIESGYQCIKIKIGSINFESELELIKKIRSDYNEQTIKIRLDANGAFAPKDVTEKLKKLSDYQIHSIEQPIRAGQIELLNKLCETSPIPIALDEELIGFYPSNKKKEILQKSMPAYIVLKPSLLGGFEASKEWIDIANQLNIGWWITSALESNIGLNAIAQWVDHLNTDEIQGLGTGLIYSNNIPSPLYIEQATLKYNQQGKWNVASILLNEKL